MKKGFYTIGSLIILLIAAFVFVFAGAGFGQKNNNSNVIKMECFDEEIVYGQNSNFLKAVTNYLAVNEASIKNREKQLEQQLLSYGFTKNTDEEAKNIQQMVSRQLNSEIYQYVLANMIIDSAAKKATKDAGYVPSDTEILSMLKYDPAFQSDSKFNATLYNNAIDSNPEMIQDKRNTISNELYSLTYWKDFETTVCSDAEIAFINSLNDKNSKRVFNMVSFNYSDYPESEKIAYGKANEDKFISYDYSILTFSDKNKAEETLNKISSKEISFEDAIKDSENIYGMNGKYANKYGYLIEKTISDETERNSVFSLKKGEISGIINTENKYSIFRADSDAKKPDYKAKTFIDAIGNYINAEQFSIIEEYFMNKAASFSEDAAKRGFAAACKKAGLKSTELPAFPLNYMKNRFTETVNESEAAMAGASSNENLLRSIFALKLNEVSKPIVNGRNVLVFQFVKNGKAPENVPEAQVIRNSISIIDKTNIQQQFFSKGNVENDANEFIEKLTAY